jgi:hypothetical protein
VIGGTDRRRILDVCEADGLLTFTCGDAAGDPDRLPTFTIIAPDALGRPVERVFENLPPADFVLSWDECGADLIAEGGVCFQPTGAALEDGARFPLGPVLVTPGVVALVEQRDGALPPQGSAACLQAVAQAVAPLLFRHVRGDFGTLGHLDAISTTPEQLAGGCFVTDDEATLSAIAARGGAFRTVSSRYPLGEDTTIRVATEVWDQGAGNHTTILLPEED